MLLHNTLILGLWCLISNSIHIITLYHVSESVTKLGHNFINWCFPFLEPYILTALCQIWLIGILKPQPYLKPVNLSIYRISYRLDQRLCSAQWQLGLPLRLLQPNTLTGNFNNF